MCLLMTRIVLNYVRECAEQWWPVAKISGSAASLSGYNYLLSNLHKLTMLDNLIKTLDLLLYVRSSIMTSLQGDYDTKIMFQKYNKNSILNLF